MVTVLLSGGLGNQMFQYAAAKALAKRLGTSPAIDLYPLIKKTHATIRPYELGIFNIDAPIVSTLRGKMLTKARSFVQKHKEFFRHFGLFTDTYAILYQPAFGSLKGNVILSGYFQNEKYFKGAEAGIRDDFTFRHPLEGKNKEIAGQLASVEPVSVHIRRGDYVQNADAASNFVTCDVSYYEKAVAHICGKVNNPSFYIFSDDFDWVKENLDFGNHPVSFVDWNREGKSCIDMRLMSLCKHNITANSSFSWWGAWLNANPDKVVVCPLRWFREEKKNSLLKDFYPEGWTMI
ncbi:MAG: alpha-1,2-fucosyltransferase [Prevotella sp.]|nr:alpha-1,2-fucosyltransferase [Prevotella sp.]